MSKTIWHRRSKKKPNTVGLFMYVFDDGIEVTEKDTDYENASNLLCWCSVTKLFNAIEALEQENKELREEIKCLEHNNAANQEFLDNQFDNAVALVDEKEAMIAQLEKALSELNREYQKGNATDFFLTAGNVISQALEKKEN